MAISEKDQQVLKALKAASEQHEELAELLGFYYDLYELQFQAKARVPEPEVRDSLAMRWRLEGGIPQLTFDQLHLEPERFAQLVAEVTDVLLRHNPTWQAAWQDRTPEDLVALAQEVFETWETLTVPRTSRESANGSMDASLPAMAVGFALAPYLQRAAEKIYTLLDSTLWSRKYCPICGGLPNFALLEEGSGARRLMCSKCASLWDYRRLGCAFCDTKERPVYYASEDGLHRLYVCQACKRYLKTVDLRKAHRVVHPMVERLLTVGMDLAANQEGFKG
jgi:FdhE protein